MTKYVLHGGNTRDINPDNDGFFNAMTEGLQGKIKVLLVYFAREEEITTDFIQEDKDRFLSNSDSKDLEFIIANPNDFPKQIQQSQIIYIRGGSMVPLHDKLDHIKDLKSLFEDKVVGGSSAGCYILSDYYWDTTNKTFTKGLGILPIRSICHYQKEDYKIIKNLPEQTVPLITLPDNKSVTVIY